MFSVTVSSGVDKTLEDAVGAVSSLGITAANLVNTGSPGVLCNALTQALNRNRPFNGYSN